MDEITRLRARVAELETGRENIVTWVMGLLSSGCTKDHSTATLEDFRGCTICLRARVAELEKKLNNSIPSA
jgi:BMFP domain-containing protein YqiC